MVQLLRNQRTHCNSSSSMYIWHSDRHLWSYLYPKCKMVVSLKDLQDPSRGTRLVCIKCHHRWYTELTGSSLMVVHISHAVNGCSHGQGSHKVLTRISVTKLWPHTHSYTQTHTNSHTWALKDSFFFCRVYWVVDVIFLSEVVVFHLTLLDSLMINNSHSLQSQFLKWKSMSILLKSLAKLNVFTSKIKMSLYEYRLTLKRYYWLTSHIYSKKH